MGGTDATSTEMYTTIGSVVVLACCGAGLFSKSFQKRLLNLFSNVEQKARPIAYRMKEGDLKRKVTVLLPPSPQKEKNGDENGTSTTANKPSSVLLLIIPGTNLSGSEYVDLCKVMQQSASSRQSIDLTVGIGFLNYSKFDRWLCDDDYKNVLNITQAAVIDAMIKSDAIADETVALDTVAKKQYKRDDLPYFEKAVKQYFDKVFVMGHSLGGLLAKDAAYPSKYDGLILYGTTMNFYKPLLVSSYPKPTLQIIGSRDGATRYLSLVKELECLEKEVHRQEGIAKLVADGSSSNTSESQSSTTVTGSSHQRDIEISIMLENPVIVLPGLNHFHMATGKLPEKTRRTGRSDLSSRIPLEEAHCTLGETVVDFLCVHSNIAETPTRSNSSTSSSCSSSTLTMNVGKQIDRQVSCQRILGRADSTKEFLDPFRQLVDAVYVSRFLEHVQEQMLQPSSQQQTTMKVVSRWRTCRDDFLYSRSRWEEPTLTIQVVEQNPLRLSMVPQVSKTMAIKGKSREAILNNNNNNNNNNNAPGATTTNKDGPSLMTINKQTFQMVLNEVVSPEQKLQYLTEGKQLEFGPDIFIQAGPPIWVDTPLSIQKKSSESGKVYCILQSPYITTPCGRGNPKYSGMWYGKPLTPAQAYEWIVFDAFKA